MKKYIYLIAALTLFTACDKGEQWVAPNLEVQKGTFIDTRDNVEYKSITINGQTWMAENLKYRLPKGPVDGCLTYEEEDDSVRLYNTIKKNINIDKAIFSARVKVLCPNSAKFGTPEGMLWTMYGAADEFCHPTRGSFYKISYSVYEFNYLIPLINNVVASTPLWKEPLTNFLSVLRQANKEQEDILIGLAIDAQADKDYIAKYGYLYSYANIEKAIPEGWRLPTDEDWKKLEESLGLAGEQLNNLEQWRGVGVASLLKVGENGTGFDAEFPGCLVYGQMMTGSKYRNCDFKSYYWTSSKLTVNDRECAIIRALQFNDDRIYRGSSPIVQTAYSIRCIKK